MISQLLLASISSSVLLTKCSHLRGCLVSYFSHPLRYRMFCVGCQTTTTPRGIGQRSIGRETPHRLSLFLDGFGTSITILIRQCIPPLSVQPIAYANKARRIPSGMLLVIKDHSKSVIIQGTSVATPKILYAYLRRESRRRMNMKIFFEVAMC